MGTRGRGARRGIDWALESEADRILAEDRRQGDRRDRGDYLSASQLQGRRVREVYNKNGVPEKGLYNGMFRRAYNPRSRQALNRGTQPDS